MKPEEMNERIEALSAQAEEMTSRMEEAKEELQQTPGGSVLT